jgi:hypothetical protein
MIQGGLKIGPTWTGVGGVGGYTTVGMEGAARGVRMAAWYQNRPTKHRNRIDPIRARVRCR